MDIRAAAANGKRVPHLVNSTPELCRDIHEWPVEPLRGSTNFFAHAAFFTLRAHAAQNHNGRLGLVPDLGCSAALKCLAYR